MEPAQPVDTRAAITPLFEHMRRASEAGIYLAALITALTLPDMLAALEAPDGRATKLRYREWTQRYMGRTSEESAALYGFRCSFLHQGSPMPHGGAARFAMVDPTEPNISIHGLGTVSADGERVQWLSIPRLIEEIEVAGDRWLLECANNELVQRNLGRFVRIRPDGFSPHIVGVSVIA